MTFRELQDDLIAEITKLLKDIVTTNANGEQVVGIKGFAHSLPVIQSDDEDPEMYLPYFIVRFDTGRTRDDDDCWHVATNIILAVHDSKLHGGHEYIVTAIQRIVNRFAYDPQLKHRYRADQDITWAMEDEDTYPYYFGAVSITFSIPKIGRKAEYDV